MLQLAPAESYGGLERTTADVSSALVAAGGRALVAAPATAAALRLRASGAELIEMDMSGRSPLRIRSNARALAEVARREGVDVIHARTREAAAVGERAAAAIGARFVTTWAKVHADDGFFDRPLTRALGAGRPVIAVSDFLARHLAEAHGLGADRVVVIPRGVDMDAFAEEAVGAERVIRLANAWGLTEDPRPVALVPGRLHAKAGLETLARAAAQLRAARGDDFLCLIVGEGEAKYVAELEAAIVDAGAAGVMRIAGPTPDMQAALKMAAMVVSPAAAPRASARSVVEAMAMGRPVIATAHGAPADVIRDRENGWLAAPGDEEALAAALGAALDLDESGRAHMGVSGRAQVRSRFTLEAMQRAVLEVYAEAAGRAFAA
ncbi:MAG: glycosyltransferase [Pseudomonadota bacterium]